MTNSSRAAALVRSLFAGLNDDRGALRELCTDDIRAWTPGWSSDSLSELIEKLGQRETAFSDIDLEVMPLDVSGDFACAEWQVAMTHTGPLVLPSGDVIDPSGARVVLHGATVAEFDGDRICSLRQYWDEFAVAEQLGLLGDALSSF